MTPKEQCQLVIHELCIARLRKDEKGIKKWITRLDYWTEMVHEEELKRKIKNEIIIPS